MELEIRLTVTDTVALLITVVALHNGPVGLQLLLRAVLADMSEFLAVATLRLANPRDNVTSLSKSLHHDTMILGPTLSLRLAKRLVGEAVVDSILLVEIALEVHVGQGNGEVRTLLGNEVETVALRTKGLLDLDEGGGRLGLGVDLDLLLDLVHVPVVDGLLQELPGLLTGHVGKVAAVNLASVLALDGSVAFESCQLFKCSKQNWSIFGLTGLLAVLAGSDIGGTLLGHVLTLAVVAFHGLGTLPEHVGTVATRADQRIGTLSDEVTLLLAVSAAGRAFLGALLGKVALLVTVATLNRRGRVGTVGLVVAVSGRQQIPSHS